MSTWPGKTTRHGEPQQRCCTSCGSPLPSNQRSNSCSMCYGDIDHGRDGYYREWAERQEQERREGDR